MRIKTEYDAAKRNYNEAPEISQVVLEAEYEAAKKNYCERRETSKVILETLSRVECMQTQENSLLLERELGMINQKACGLINQTITKTLPDSGMSLEDMDVGHSTRIASSRVSVMQYPGCAIDTERVTRSCSLAVSSGGTKISVATYKDPFLRKLE